MKIVHSFFITCLFFMVCSGLLISCGNRSVLRQLQTLEVGVPQPKTQEELEAAIAQYQTKIDTVMNEYQRIGSWQKLLALRYLDNKMYKKSFEAFSHAHEIYPENKNILYYVGLTASLTAKNSLNLSSAAQKELLHTAEKAYQQALIQDPHYVKALYALSVLYVFELDAVQKAVPLLETAVEQKKEVVQSLFLLARAYYTLGQKDRAYDCYQRILESNPNDSQKRQAQSNMEQLAHEAH